MTPGFVVVWSGALERDRKAPGLSSPLIPCVTAEAMRRSYAHGELSIKFAKPKAKRCLVCGVPEQRNRHNGKGSFGAFAKTCKPCRAKRLQVAK